MKTKLKVLTIFLPLLLLFLNCEKNTNPLSVKNAGPDDNGIKLDYSAADSLEAREMGLWFSGRLLVPDSTFADLLFSINYLRKVHGDSFSILTEERFMPPWKIGVLMVNFDSSTAQLVTNHQYTGWDSLETWLQPDSILDYPDRLGIAVLAIDSAFNPRVLSEIYQHLPGVNYSEPYMYISIGGPTFPIFPGYVNGEMTYLFVDNPTYIAGPYYYFKYVNGEPVYIGEWDGYSPTPDWWEEARLNIKNFHDWNGP